MQIKIHRTYRDIVAICDTELLGKYFDEGKFQLDIKESFYRGEEVNEKELLNIIRDMIREDAIFNIVGEKSIKCIINAGIISKEATRKIAGIPFTLILL